MRKIGISFPQNDFQKISENDFTHYLNLFKEAGLYSFDMYTDFVLHYHPLNKLLEKLRKKNIRLTFHYRNNLVTNDFGNKLKYLKKDLRELRKILNKNNHDYQTSIVFHLPVVQNDKYTHIKEMIKLFKTISDYGTEYNFQILIETLVDNEKKHILVGKTFAEITLFLNNILSKNFGVCWDIGHTRLNHIVNYEPLFIPKKILQRTGFIHIHNFYHKNNEYHDHVPLTNLKFQDDEIKYLALNNYKGIYSLEFEMESLVENINVYIDSINKLKKYLINIEGEK